VLCSVERDSFEGDLERETKTKKDEYQKEGGEGRRRRRRRTTRREREREREMGEGGVRLPPRASRGRRMTRMLEDEDSADEAFWNQDAFKEEQNDEAYESEEEVADVFDADFDEEESDEEEEEVEVEKERRKKAMKAPERRTTLATKKKRKEKMMMLGSDERGKKEGNDGEEKKEATTTTTTTETVVIPRELRLSSRASAKEIREKSEQLRREREARPQLTRPKVEYVVPTMEEMIKEAKITEKKNLIELEYLLHLEEEQKKKNQMMDRKKRYDGPAIRQRSLKGDAPGKIVYELIRGATCERDAPEFYLKGEQHRKKEDKICAITGLPAKYRDPKSGSYYATIDAFKQLRLQQEKKEAEEKEKEKENAGIDVPVKMEDEQQQQQQQQQQQNQEQPKRASIWDPPVPGALTHREIAQMAKRKAEKEEQAAMQAFLKEQEEAKAALRRKKQGKTAAAAKIVPQAKRTKAQIKKANEAMKREEEANRNLRGPGRWLSMKTILSRPELDVPTVGTRHPRPVLQGFSKPGIPKYVVATPQSVGERPLEEEEVKIEQPNFDTGDDGGTTVATAGHNSPNMRHIDSCDIMAIDDNNEDEALTNSDDFTVEDASEDDVDDEETIEEDERAALEEDDVRLNLTAEEERNALEDEANIPIEELMRRYQANNRQFGKKEP